MDNNPILSVIVPVYNVEDYIIQCIDSILNQTLKNMEIIIVNDGSTDNIMNYIRDYKDERIRIINKKNGGLSSARNLGMNAAKGKYIAFVDSDDFLSEKNAYQEMVNILEKNKAELITGKALYFYDLNTIKKFERDEEIFNKDIITSEEYLIQSIKNNRIYVTVWNNIFNKEFLIKNNLMFIEGIINEDELFMNKVLMKVNNICLYNQNFYMYRQRNGSIMKSTDASLRLNSIYYISLELEKDIKKITNNVLKECLYSYIALMALNVSISCRNKKIPMEIRNLIKIGLIDKEKINIMKRLFFNETLFYFCKDSFDKFKYVLFKYKSGKNY